MESWKYEHNKAMLEPNTHFEKALVSMLRGIDAYILANEEMGWKIADDHVLGFGLALQIEGFRALLDGELGRLDGGTLWSAIDKLARRAGWDSLEDVCNMIWKKD